MNYSIRHLTGIVLAIMWLSVGLTAFAEGELQAVKGPYDEQVGKIRSDCDAHLKDLSQQYTQGMQTLEAQFKRAGDLDSVLAVRKELERFKDAETVTTGDMVEAPAEVSALQRTYINGKNAATRDRNKQIGKLATAYVAQLEQLKRTLTQKDNIIAALEVQKELEQVRDSGDLPAPVASTPTPKQPRPFAPPVTPVVTPPVTPASTAPLTVMHSPKGTLTVVTTDNGAPAKGVWCFFQTEPDGKVARDNTDTSGKIIFHIETGNTYRLVIISDKYADVEMSGLKEGENYPVKLVPHGQNEGVVEVVNRVCRLPDIGRLSTYGGWSSSNGEHGMDLRAENPKVKVTSNYVTRGMNMNNNGVTTYSSSYFMVSDGRTATFQINDTKYEVKAIIIGDHSFLAYKKQ